MVARDDPEDGLTPGAMGSLTLPATLDELDSTTAADLDDLLSQDERPVEALEAKLASYHHMALSHLTRHNPKQTIDLKAFGWPSFLYIPGGSDYRFHWISPPPDDHRYAREWVSSGASPNKASRQDGTLFSFTQLHQENAGTSRSTEAGVGVLYRPPMSLGVVDLQPQLSCSGILRTKIDIFPNLAAGSVEVKAWLLLAQWQVIPGGFDLLAWKSVPVATSGRRDQSHGAEKLTFDASFADASLSAPFVVQGGRTYLLGVVGRVSVVSTLTSNNGRPLPPQKNAELVVYGQMSCVIPEIHVMTKRMDIP